MPKIEFLSFSLPTQTHLPSVFHVKKTCNESDRIPNMDLTKGHRGPHPPRARFRWNPGFSPKDSPSNFPVSPILESVAPKWVWKVHSQKLTAKTFNNGWKRKRSFPFGAQPIFRCENLSYRNLYVDLWGGPWRWTSFRFFWECWHQDLHPTQSLDHHPRRHVFPLRLPCFTAMSSTPLMFNVQQKKQNKEDNETMGTISKGTFVRKPFWYRWRLTLILLKFVGCLFICDVLIVVCWLQKNCIMCFLASILWFAFMTWQREIENKTAERKKRQ